jgi:hypothetical protein
MLIDREFDEIFSDEASTHVGTKRNQPLAMAAQLEEDAAFLEEGYPEDGALLEVAARMKRAATVLRGVAIPDAEEREATVA